MDGVLDNILVKIGQRLYSMKGRSHLQYASKPLTAASEATNCIGSFQPGIGPKQQSIRPFAFIIVALYVQSSEHFARGSLVGIARLKYYLSTCIERTKLFDNLFAGHFGHEIIKKQQVYRFLAQQF